MQLNARYVTIFTKTVRMASVLIVDHQFLRREGIKQILASEYRGMIFAEATSLTGLSAQLRESSWDLIAINLHLPGGDGFTAISQARKLSPASRILAVSSSGDPGSLARSVSLGVSACISDTASRPEVLRAFHKLLAGEDFNRPRESQPADSAPLHTALTLREFEVMLSIAAGRRPGSIAAALNLSPQTVSTYRRRILNKLGFSCTADLVRYVIDAKLS